MDGFRTAFCTGLGRIVIRFTVSLLEIHTMDIKSKGIKLCFDSVCMGFRTLCSTEKYGRMIEV